MMKIGIVGLWHQGIVGAACLAEAGHAVTARDGRAVTVASLQSGISPIYEPGLDDLLKQGLSSGRLSFTESVAEAVSDAEVVFLMHDTPVDEQDFSDLSGVFADVEAMIPHLRDGVTLLVTAQVQVGTCDHLRDRIHAVRPELSISIAYIPENLRLGQALERFRDPPLPVVGTEDDAAFAVVCALFPSASWERVSLRTGEMVKHALNGFLATCVTFANEVGNLCDEVGADGHRLAEVLRMEPRVGPKAMLFPGLGFSGGTLARDVQTLRGLGDSHGLETPMLDGLWASNRQQNDLVLRKLRAALGRDLTGKRVAILGITYKPDTSTLRRSAALGVAEALRAEGAEVRATDPMADRHEVAELAWLTFDPDPMVAVEGADAVVLMTPWKHYRELDPPQLAAKMAGKVVIDTANLWKPEPWADAGLIYLDIGRGRKQQGA